MLELAVTIPLLSKSPDTQVSSTPNPVVAVALGDLAFGRKPVLEHPDFDKEILEPLRKEQARLASEEAARIAEAARQAELAKQRAQAFQSAQNGGGTLIAGSLGYALPYGNCVLEPGVNRGYGNPINWPVLSTEPWIGATFLWYSNHTGVVTGFWSNGDIEVRHQNAWGGRHRYPRSMFRGFR